ncbi:MAG: quinolinate synthase NadA [Kiritimatiellae bacterium]|nr:quinolinate synthase NadA [Kiritimatiellia bacterium]
MQSSVKDLLDEIAVLRRERNAVILAHNYTTGDVQDVADHTGDSLELARRAARVEADVIVFCGVYFMAETAKILNPSKTVLIPDALAGCPMADMINAGQLREFKAAHPGAKAVCYVNSTAEVKAQCDMCVTSGNAERVMRSFPPDEKILFVPDRHLGGHIASLLGRRYELWQGCCPVHAKLTAGDIAAARAAHPGAVVMVHPECPEDVREAADVALSTGGMCAFAKESPAREFIVGTETGILHRLVGENPDKKFHPAKSDLVCADMKKITLEKLRDSLAGMKTEVVLPEEISARARRAIEAMLELG